MRKILTVAVGAAITLGSFALAPAASAADEVWLRDGDVTFEDASGGHHEFLGNGLRVYTDSDAGKAAGYIEVAGALADVTNASMVWQNKDGFTAEPGLQIVFDVDGELGNGNDYNLLVGESVYGDDWWLTPASSQAAKDADPSGADTGGYGSEWHGTLDEWAAALPDSSLFAAGYSLGSGAHGDGVLGEMVFGDTTYKFTNKPEAKPVAAAAIESPKARVAKVHVTAKQPAGTLPTPKGAYYKVLHTVKGAAADGVIQPDEIVKRIASGYVEAGDPISHKATFPKAKKPIKVTVISYDKIIADKRIALK